MIRDIDQAAGALFGELSRRVGFGDVTMTFVSDANSGGPCYMYVWDFKTRGEKRSYVERVSIGGLAAWHHDDVLPIAATNIVARWKSKERRRKETKESSHE